MRLGWIALALLLSACSTPQEVRNDGTRHDYALRLPPADAAKCLARNADDHSGYITPTLREAGGTFEVLVKGLDSTLAVAEVRPASSGSSATIWRAHIPAMPFGLPAAMVKGC
jgi:hypothetical protein